MTYIHPAKQISGEEEVAQILEVANSGHFAGGIKTTEFEKLLKKFIGVRHVVTTNSGSSANLLALSVLAKGFPKGMEVITAACGFPTTVNPIIQNGFIPVFVDVALGTYVPTLEMIREAITEKTAGIVLAHTLGNPFAVEEVAEICKELGLFLVEDSCDALGSTYNGRMVGTFGDFGTLSFYPAHHISTGEGGAVVTNKSLNMVDAESFRDWGRSCWCPPGVDNTCGKRFEHEYADLPYGFDHKYVYNNLGYNLKMSDLNAAVGVAQMGRLEGFIHSRRENHEILGYHLRAHGMDEFFIPPVATKKSNPSWFGYCLTIRDGMPFTRRDVVTFLESEGIGTRQLFGGNLLHHPAYQNIDYRISQELKNSDKILKDTFWIGCHPGIGQEERQRIVLAFDKFTESL
jgi:CDP-6-deoxy-D-xylo-4-hexulose-3-dehydrase